MVKKSLLFGTLVMVLALALGLVLAGCDNGNNTGPDSNPNDVQWKGFTSIGDMGVWLTGAAANTADNPYAVRLTGFSVDGLSGGGDDPLGALFANLYDKYVILDLSGLAGTEIADIDPQPVESRQNKDRLVSVILPNGIASIGNYVFSECAGLTSVTIPDGAIDIGTGAFQSSGLANVSIPSSVAHIWGYAFNDCSNLADITVDEANAGYSSQDGVLFNKTKTTLVQYPARNSKTSYAIPDSVTRISGDAFFRCTGLTHINVDDANANYSSQDGVLFNKTKTTLIQYMAGNSRTSCVIPDGVASIERSAFDGCAWLASVIMPDSVNRIGWAAFSGCSGLSSITIPGSVTSIEGWAFYSCTGLASVTFGEDSNITSFGEHAFPGYDGFNVGSLLLAYFSAESKAGTYMREAGGSTWSKL